MKRLKVGIIGLGVGENHIAGYRKHPDCDVVALCDFNEAKLALASKKYPQMRLYAQANNLIDDPGVQVVSVASYDNYHFEQIARAIERGKHVFAEKPLVLHEHELRRVRSLLEHNPGVKISSNLILRRCPRFLQLRQMIQDGDLGEIYHLEGDYNYGRIHKITQGWRGEIEYYSVFLGGGVHLIDLLLWLTQRRITKVAAFGTNLATHGSSFRYNDTVMAILTFENGMTGKVGANFASVYPHFHKLSVYGTAGTFENALGPARIFRSRDPDMPPVFVDTPYPGVAKGDLIENFIDSICNGTEAEVTTKDVLASMSVCLAVEKAVLLGETINVEYI